MPSNTPATRDVSPEFALLGLIAQQPEHGYQLHLRLNEALGHVWRISQSQCYAVLARLEHKGDITSREEHVAGKHARHLFRLTQKGRRRLEAWLFTPSTPRVRAIRTEFSTRLYCVFALHPSRISEVIAEQTVLVRRALQQQQHTLVELDEDDVFNRLSVSLRVRQLQSVLTWLADCDETLGQPGLGSFAELHLQASEA